MPEAVIVSAARSPIGRAVKGSLKDVRPDDLTASIIQAALDKVPELDPAQIDDLMLGCGLPGGEQGHNLGRVVAVRWAWTTCRAAPSPATAPLRSRPAAWRCTPSRPARGTCSSRPASRRSPGRSTAPPTACPTPTTRSSPTPRPAPRPAPSGGGEDWYDPREDGTVPDVYIAMGQTAENLARLKGITRREMDEFGVRSQNLAEKALADGFWEREITPVTTPDGTVVAKDDGPRRRCHSGGRRGPQAGLPARRPRHGGQLLRTQRRRGGAGHHVRHQGPRTGADPAGADRLHRTLRALPEIMGHGPVEASKQALARAGMTIGDIDLVEINEAFAAQVIPSYQDLGIDLDKLNVNGGAIAVGHPFGMTGARITTTLINSLQWHDKQFALETMCVGGGQGMAMVIERLS